MTGVAAGATLTGAEEAIDATDALTSDTEDNNGGGGGTVAAAAADEETADDNAARRLASFSAMSARSFSASDSSAVADRDRVSSASVGVGVGRERRCTTSRPPPDDLLEGAGAANSVVELERVPLTTDPDCSEESSSSEESK